MKNIALIFLVFCSALSLQSSCQKDEPSKLIENDTTFLSYWYFPKDSYWIYKDSVTNELDTFVVESTDIQEQNDHNSSNKFQFHVFRILNQGVVKTQVGRPIYFGDNTYYYSLDQRWGTISSGGSAVRLFYDKYNRISNLGNTLFYVNHFDSILIGNQHYFNVIHIYNVGQSNGDSVRHEYYAKNIGIVKRIYESNHVWELKEYFIKK